MDKDELLKKARKEYPVGTYVFNEGTVHEIEEELYWQHNWCISHIGVPPIYDSMNDIWIAKCDKDGNILEDSATVDNYEIF